MITLSTDSALRPYASTAKLVNNNLLLLWSFVFAIAGSIGAPLPKPVLLAAAISVALAWWQNRPEAQSPAAAGAEFSDALVGATRTAPLNANGAKVTLVGAGPGSPDLLTIAAYNAIKTADVVISDRIACPALHALVPPHAKLLIAGKIPGKADAAQEEVNAWGIDALRQGKRVVRLKVGDPYLYGRGGEEFQFYASHGFAADVIPGVPSALVAPLVAGIPVTHRGVANSLLISTGQGRAGTFPDLPAFDEGRTLVLLMAVGRIPKLFDDLTSRGYPAHTPVAIVERATHADERVTRTRLDTLAADAAAAGVASPAIIVIGEVVRALEGAMADLRAMGMPLTFGPAATSAKSQEPGWRPWRLAPAVTDVRED